MNSSVLIENKRKDILILGEGRAQGLDDTIISSRSKMTNQFYTIMKKICIKSTL